MKKERLFPYWTNLEQVISVMQSRTSGDFTLTLVSIEIYARHGFLLTVNAETQVPSTMFDRGGRGWARAQVVDQDGSPYTSLLATIDGQTYNHLFSGRAILICMPPLPKHRLTLSITIDSITWEYVERPDEEPSSIMLEGPWQFNVSF
jgi:hypothetical protein